MIKLPEEFLETMKEMLGDEYQAFLDSYEEPRKYGLRVNTLKISPEETMVFGDNHNDLEMIKSAAESYAVGNAAQAVKEAAKYVTDTNVNDGVLKVLRTLVD